MCRKLLIALLSIALIIELVLSIGSLFAREATLHQFGVAGNDHTSFLAYVVGWCLLFVSLVCGLVLWRVIRRGDYAALGHLLGSWWVGIGIGIYAAFQRPDNLLLDTLKGALLILLIYLTRREEKKQATPAISAPIQSNTGTDSKIEFTIGEKEAPIEVWLEPYPYMFTAASGTDLAFVAHNCSSDFRWSLSIDHEKASIQIFPEGKLSDISILKNGVLEDNWAKITY